MAGVRVEVISRKQDNAFGESGTSSIRVDPSERLIGCCMFFKQAMYMKKK